MKRGILILTDLEANMASYITYALNLAITLDKEVTLLNCYPKAVYNRRFEFSDDDYSSGIIRTMKSEVLKNIDPGVLSQCKLKYIAAAGSLVEKVGKISKDYDLLIMRTQIYKSSVNKFLNSNISFLTDASLCPILILPPDLLFKLYENVWLIEREKKDADIIKGSLNLLNITETNLHIKRLNQNTYTSKLWEILNSKLNFQNSAIKQRIEDQIKKEKVDLILMNSYTQKGFKTFMNIALSRLIFQLGIPILITHEFKKNS